MDAQKFGAFVAQQRKEKKMTQAELAEKLHVTAKAVSRWERGIGFPDINTIEPLAQALEISILELMKSERVVEQTVPRNQATEAVVDALQLAKEQRMQERKGGFKILAAALICLILVLYLDTMDWQADQILFTLAGVGLPLFCVCGGFALLGYGVWRKAAGKSSGQIFGIAAGMFVFLLCFLGLFVLAGSMGVGPVPT